MNAGRDKRRGARALHLGRALAALDRLIAFLAEERELARRKPRRRRS